MKKLGKKLSFLTKVMLVIGLLISNLSSLSIVFADEVTIDVVVSNDKLNLKYLGELAEEVETVQVNVYENYTYLDATFEEEVVSNYPLTSEELNMLVSLEGDGLVVDSILSDIVFDGTYNVKVEVVDTTDETVTEPVVIDSREFSTDVLHESGLKLNVVNTATGEVIEALENGKYPVSLDGANIAVVANVLAGGLNPTDMFMYDEVEYMASELLSLEFSSEMDFSGRLFGDYIVPVEVKVLNSKTSEEIVYTDELNVLFESYELNAYVLNAATETEELSLSETYEFASDTKDGVLYVLLDGTKTNTMFDLYRLASFVFDGDETITYLLSNSEYEDVLSSYDEATATVTLEEYLKSILLDDTCVLSLINEGLTVTYKVVVAGDNNNDNALTEEDLLELVNQVVGVTDVNVEKSDLYELDGNVNTLDVMYLDQVLKNETWNVVLTEDEATLDAALVVNKEDIVSGDEFTVDYVVTLSDYAVNGVSGLFTYDNTMLELVSVETASEWLGNAKDGKFLYLGGESLMGTVTENEDGTTTVTPVDYVMVTATFKALKSGTSTVTVNAPEYFNQASYLVLDEMLISTDVVVNASDNNNLSSLTVAGQTITLEENVLDYEITVGNDVTTADVEAIVENVAAQVTSVVYPEELVEGANTVTITVTSESGDVKVYTITVIREEAPEEETTTTQVNYNNYYDNNEDEDEPVEITPEVEEEEEEPTEVEEESNLSRIVIIILILLVIAGLIYLIFKDDEDEETKKANKDINKLKKEDKELEVKSEKKSNNNSNNKPNNNSKNKNSKNKKKER